MSKTAPALSRHKYLWDRDLTKFTTAVRRWAEADLHAGRRLGVVAWMFVDMDLETGLRASELCRLDWKHINVRQRFMLVKRSKRRDPDAPLEEIAITDKLARHLREYLAWCEASGIPTGDDDPVLRSERGRYSTRGLRHLMHAICDRANMPRRGCHTMRHTAGVLLGRQSNNIKMVQQQLGHRNIADTARYFHVMPDQMRDSLAAANATWRKST